MGDKTKRRFGTKAYKQLKDHWSFGWGLSHGFGETYVYINLFVVSVYIGILNVYED